MTIFPFNLEQRFRSPGTVVVRRSITINVWPKSTKIENRYALQQTGVLSQMLERNIGQGIVVDVLEHYPEQEQFLHILAWSALTATRYVADHITRTSDSIRQILRQVA